MTTIDINIQHINDLMRQKINQINMDYLPNDLITSNSCGTSWSREPEGDTVTFTINFSIDVEKLKLPIERQKDNEVNNGN